MPLPGINTTTVVPDYDLTKIKEEQKKDVTMAPLIVHLEAGKERPPYEDVSAGPPALKTYWAQWPMLAVRDGVLCRKWEDDDGKHSRWLIVLPTTMRSTILHHLHECKTAGHMGETKTRHKVRQRYYWTGMVSDIKFHIRQCEGCAQRKGPQRKRRATLKQLKVGGPLERVAIDVLGPLPESEDGNLYVLVIGDYFTKWVEAYAIPDQTAETVATKIFEEFVCRFGVPLELHSDQGRNFEARVFQELCKMLGINKTRTTPYNPKSDGMIERFNRTLVNIISLMIEPIKNQRDWDKYLPHVGFAYRSCVHETTGQSPNTMMLGREVTLPVNLTVEGPPDEPECDTYYVEELRDRLRQVHERARQALQANSARQKKNYDRRAVGGGFAVGDFVWLFRNARKPGVSRKLALPWDGPYLITSVLGDVVYRIQKTQRSKPMVVHNDRLKCYQGVTLKSWLPTKKHGQNESEATVEEVVDVGEDRLQRQVRSEGEDIGNSDGSPTQQAQRDVEDNLSSDGSPNRRNPGRARQKPVRFR